MEYLAFMSLRHTETNLGHTEFILPDCHTVHKPAPYSTHASAIQNKIFKTLVYVLKKKILEFVLMHWKNIFSLYYIYIYFTFCLYKKNIS